MQTDLNIGAGTFRVVVIVGKFLLNNALLFTGEEGLPYHANGHIVECARWGGSLPHQFLPSSPSMEVPEKNYPYLEENSVAPIYSCLYSPDCDFLCKASLRFVPIKGFDATTA